MNKRYKFVSGRGRVEMSQDEINELVSGSSEPIIEPKSLSELWGKVEKILAVLESLKLISSFSKTGNEDDVIGNS